MKSLYFDDIKKALKSKEYWFGFSVIIISCVITAIYNLSPAGVFGTYKIGSSEFFIAGMMEGNSIFQISAPVIAVFACMNQFSIFMKEESDIQKTWKEKEMKAHMLANMIIGGSVFLLAFLLLFISGMIAFPPPTKSIEVYYGLFKDLYQNSPIGYIFLYVGNSFFCGALYALFGFALKVWIVKPTNIVLFIPLVYNSCFVFIGRLFPFIGGFIDLISPLLIFDISIFDIPLTKRVSELAFILVISLTLIIISYFKNKKLITRVKDIETKLTT